MTADGNAGSAVLQHDRNRYRDGVGLSDIMHVELESQIDPLDHGAGRAHHRANLLACRDHTAVECGNVQVVKQKI